MAMQLGVTGTRYVRLVTTKQLRFLYNAMTIFHETGGRTLHHGACPGWDLAAHHLALSLGWDIVIHPGKAGVPIELSGDVLLHNVTVLAPKENRPRNADIVDSSSILVAGPAYPEDDGHSRRSGTWMTIRMAREAMIRWQAVFPDGSTLYGEW